MSAPTLTPPEHTATAAIDAAADWLLSADRTGQAIVPELRQRFGLTSLEACEAIREANRRRYGR